MGPRGGDHGWYGPGSGEALCRLILETWVDGFRRVLTDGRLRTLNRCRKRWSRRVGGAFEGEATSGSSGEDGMARETDDAVIECRRHGFGLRGTRRVEAWR